MNSRRWRLPKRVFIPLVVFVLVVTGVMLWQSYQAQITRQELNRLRILPEMVSIPAGKFWMGSPDNEVDRYDSEGPLRKVTIKRFLIGKHEVTFAEYDKFVEATARQLPPDEGWGRGKHPVINVTWEDAVGYTKWLSRLTGKDYRLPTEAEWEYAARAGKPTAFSFGDNISKLGEYAWYKENSEEKTHPVCQKKPNAWGLYDMHGNVWEWVEDDWHDNYEGAPTDGKPWIYESTRGASRVIRGGSWGGPARYCRSAIRLGGEPGGRDASLGFRLARSVALDP
jgi:formylglycine-generating enzyme required for sulfatase activity